MNFDGFQPHPIERFSSQVEQDDATNLPLGVSPAARNVRFHLTGARTRDGIQARWGIQLPAQVAVTGLIGLKAGGVADLKVPLFFDDEGTLYIEAPAGSGDASKVANPQLSLPANVSMQATAAYTKGFLAFTDLLHATGPNAVYNIAKNTLDPLSMKPLGVAWSASTAYQVGEIVTPAMPVGGNGHSYRCVTQGTSGGSQPAFPEGEGATVADGTATWKENTPLMAQAIPVPAAPVVAHSGSGGSFAAGRDVYLIVTLSNASGETAASTAYSYANTSGSDQFTVDSPVLALWVQALANFYKVTGYSVYEADVATGSPAPALSAYKLVASGVAIGVNQVVTNSGTGAAPPNTNGALIVPAGNICAGLRYAVVMFLNRNGYITGWTQAAAILYNGPSSGFQLYMPYLPIGPPNTQARIVAFTPAGQLSQAAGYGISIAGPYFWIPPVTNLQTAVNFSDVPDGVTIADVVNGVQMTSTLINDNFNTTATFNFTDDYLKSTLLDVSAYARKIQIPAATDIQYLPSINRLFYKTDTLPSGFYVSLQGDPESVYGDTGALQVAENDGENAVTTREYGTVIYALKDRSGHVITPTPDDPSKWQAVRQWFGSGPAGPRAVDVCTRFMCYAGRQGVYIFEGGQPDLISKELPISWRNVNWAYGHKIWVMIDDETREIRVGVPYGQSTVPNLVLKCNYEESPNFAPPVHFSQIAGKEIASGECYKWSVDDIAANLAVRIERPLLNPSDAVDPATRQSQILYASSNDDGAISAIIPFEFDDNGVGIDSYYETAAPQDLMRPNRLGGVQANVDGYGQITVEVLALRAKSAAVGGISPTGPIAAVAGASLRLAKPLIAGVPYSCGGRMTNERMRLRFSNGKRLGTWFDLKWASIYAAPVSAARPG